MTLEIPTATLATFATEARVLSRDYGAKRALDAVNLRIERGRIVALLGPNGAGKTTLLKLMAGLMEPTEGEVWTLGEPSREMSPETLTRVANLLDGHEPPPWARGRSILALQEEASSRFDRAYAESICFGRGVKPGERYGALSKGQKRWLLAGVALATRADLMLLDEPADGLDPEARRALYDALRERVNDCEATAIVSTHVIADIERVADDVAILHRGRIVLHAALEDLREETWEIETPAGATPVTHDRLRVLARTVDGEIATVIVHCPGGRDALQAHLPPDARIVGGVGLESLYLAVAGSQEGEEGEV